MRRYIGTFHKTGTVLFKRIIRAAERRQVLVPWIMREGPAPEHWDVGFDDLSTRILEQFDPDPDRSRFVVSIRDPRDVIVSAAYFHSQATEKWLHVPDRRFGGLTYQEKILSFPSMQDRFLFEMEHYSRRQIRGMLKLPIGAPSLSLTRLEQLVEDVELVEFRHIFSFLAFEQSVQEQLLLISRRNSLFSGQVPQSGHVRSGKARQWVTEFHPSTLACYEKLFGDAAERLGYLP